jgi:hypothetical protein
MPRPHDFTVRSNRGQSFRRTMCCPPNFSRGVEAPFVRALSFAHGKPPCEPICAPDAATSTASNPAFVTIAKRPLCRDWTAGLVEMIWVSCEAENFSKRGWTGFGDLPDGNAETLLQDGLDTRVSGVGVRKTRQELMMINRLRIRLLRRPWPCADTAAPSCRRANPSRRARARRTGCVALPALRPHHPIQPPAGR